jgi:phosphonate transport system substrate-binding protein
MDSAGKKFSFGSESSTSGRLMPEFFIRQATGKAPGEFFAEVSFSGAHDKTILQVRDGNWDIGVVDFGVYDDMVASGELDPSTCRVIWETPSYADYQFTIRPGLDTVYGAGFTMKLTEALLGMDAELCRAFGRDKMVPASNADFAGILDVATKLGMIR